MKSSIFTDAELLELERRKKGDLKDAQGLFAGRIKPRIMELLSVWFPQRKTLQKLIEPKRRKKDGSQN